MLVMYVSAKHMLKPDKSLRYNFTFLSVQISIVSCDTAVLMFSLGVCIKKKHSVRVTHTKYTLIQPVVW